MTNNLTDKSLHNHKHDILFKELIITFFKEYLELTQPTVAKRIDFNHISVLEDHMGFWNAAGKNQDIAELDTVIQVHRKKTRKKLIFYIESHSQKCENLPWHILCGFSSYLDCPDSNAIPQSICLNSAHSNIYNEHHSSQLQKRFGTELHFRYEKIDLTSLNLDEHKNSNNPFSIACLPFMQGFTDLTPTEKMNLKIEAYINLYKLKLDLKKSSLVVQLLEMNIPTDTDTINILEEQLRIRSASIPGFSDWILENQKEKIR
ncbi:hypothetical protein bcgnr5390_12810 [Bacillus luti]|nr:hypothetical protein BC2903_51490 [Bacillus cereus]